MNKSVSRCAAALVAMVLLHGVPAQATDGYVLAQAKADMDIDQAERLTKDIVRKCVELEKYNLNYKLNVAKQGRWKGWRYLTGIEAANGVGLAAFIVGTGERGRNFRTFKKNHRRVLETGNILGGIGNILGASASATEFGINAFHDIEATYKGFSPGAARKKVRALRHEIDSLLESREVIVNQLSATQPGYAAFAQAEGKVLRDMRDMSLLEFADFQTNGRRYLAFQQSLYVFDMAKCTTGAIASRYGWLALHTGDRRNNLPSGILGLVSASITIANPVVSRGIGMAVGKYHRVRTKEIVSGIVKHTPEDMTADLEKMKQLATTSRMESDETPILRSALYDSQQTGVKKQLALGIKETQNARLTAAENVFSGTFIGGTRLAGAILFTLAGHNFTKDARHTNINLGVNNILGTVSVGYSTIQNLRLQVKRELAYQRLKKKGETPGQIVKQRLQQLNDIEKVLNTDETPKKISEVM